MWIKNGFVFGEDGRFSKRDLATCGKVIDHNSSDDIVIDATDLYVIPGLTDIHLHGCAGYDFCDASTKALDAITEYQLSRGITTLCPTSMTYDEETLTHVFSTIAEYDNPDGATMAGIHMEGPFLSSAKAGAQNPVFLRTPDIDLFYRLQKAAKNMIKICDIAPELIGAFDVIKKLSEDVHVSLAHSDASYDTAMVAFSLGADHVTHLFNGMSAFHHREPGLIGAAADYENAYVELIGDGIHIAPSVLRATLKMLGEHRVVFVSDSMRACGMPDGTYELGGQKVIKSGKYAKLADGTLAGSAVDLMDILKTVVLEMNIPLETAVLCTAVNSAKSIGIYDTYGSLEIGKRANILLLDKNLNLKHIIKDGRCH